MKDLDKVRALFADEDAFLASAMSGGTVDVVVTVPAAAFAEAWERMGQLVEESPDFQGLENFGPADANSLRVLCGVYWAAFLGLPIGPDEHLRLVEQYDEELSGGQYVQDFVARWKAREMAELPADELRVRLLDHLDDKAATPIKIASLREMVNDDEGLEIVRGALARA